MKTKFAVGAALASSLLMLGVGAMGAASARPAQAMGKYPLVLGDQDGSPTFTENFNPLSVNALQGWWFMYEPMYAVDSLTGKPTPELATGYKWVTKKELQFTIRNGVKWSNGQAFTAQDVAFTFNLMKKNPALDLNGLWKVLNSVSAKGNVVTFTFKQVDIPL